MNYIDIAIIGLLVLSLLFGLIGKLHKKIRFLIGTLISLPLAYLLSGLFAKADWLNDLIAQLLEKANISDFVEKSESLQLIFSSTVRFVLFYVLFLLLALIFVPIILAILSAIIVPKKKKANSKFFNRKAVISFGLIQLVTSAIILAYFVLPVALAKPALKNFDENRAEIGVSFDTSKINDLVENSLFLNLEEKALSKNAVPFLGYKEGEGENVQKYSYYDDFNDIAIIVGEIPTIKNIASSLNLSMDLNSSSAIEEKMNSFGVILGSIDDLRNSLSDNSKIKSALAEILEYYIIEEPKTNSSLSFLQNAGDYLDSFDFVNDSYKDKLLPIIVQSYIDSIEGDNKFAMYIDVTEYNFNQLKTQLAKLPELVKIFGSKENVSKEEIKSVLTTSDLSAQVVSGLLNDYYTDHSITSATLDYDKEADALSLVLNYTNSDDNSSLDQIVLVNSLSESDLLPAILDFYTRTNTPLTIKVDTLKYTAIKILLDAKKANNELTTQQYNTYLAMFVEESVLGD